MSNHNETGKRGEALAACWLAMQGFQILFKNWRHGRGEIDIIARKQGVIHIVEVKTGCTTTFGYPEERINRRKWKTMFRVSDEFLSGWRGEVEIQFDVISVFIDKKTVHYHHIENAFCLVNTES